MPAKNHAPRDCHGTNKQGEPCKAWPLHGSDYCLAHDEKAREKKGFGGSQPSAGRPRKPRPTEVTYAEFQKHAYAAIRVVVAKLDDVDSRVALQAAGMILDRAFGRPHQALEVSGEIDHTIAAAGRAVVEDAEMRRLADAATRHLVALDAGPVRTLGE